MFTLTAITFEQEIRLSVQKDVPSSWMNPQIQFLQLVPVWCFIFSDHWISRKLFLIVGEVQMVPNHSFSFCSLLWVFELKTLPFGLRSGKKI